MTALGDVAGRAGAMPDERQARTLGWTGCAVAVIGFLLTVPPFSVRTPAPTVVLAAIAVGLGLLAVRGGAKRHGWIAVVLAVLGVVLGVAATRTDVGSLEVVVSWGALLAATLRFATPLTFAALGGLVSERSGVVNIGLEGMMLMGAFFAAWGADVTGSWVGGIVIGVLAGMALAVIHAVFAVLLRADQILSGFALTFIAAGLTGYLYVDKYGEQGTPDDLPAIPDVHLPIDWIPFIGEGLADLNVMVWLGLIMVAVLSIYLFRTASGLRVRSVGENPLAADTAGISPIRVRYLAVIASGAFAALGGVFLSIGFVHSFSQNMTAGKGFIGLAVVIVGKWKPGGALAAALLFGFSSALAQRLPVFSPTTATLLQALPYVLTLIAVAGLVGRSRPPAADGIPYERH
jgi:ABC-type uncharacterized transport system permease subunit